MKNSEKVRVQFDFLPEAVERLDELVAKTGAASRAEVVRKALVLLDRALMAEGEGDELIFRSKVGAEKHIVLV